MKRLLSALALAISGSMLAAAPALAQGGLAPGYSGQSGTRYLPLSDSWFTIRQLGACLAQQKLEPSRAMLAAVPGSPEEDRAVHQLIGRETSCLRGAHSLQFTRDMLRGSVAEALYQRGNQGPPPPASSEDAAVTDFAGFAGCIVAARPAQVHELLTTTRLGTDEERRLVARMAPEMGPCLPQGVELSLQPPLVRLALAEAIYRASIAPPADAPRSTP